MCSGTQLYISRTSTFIYQERFSWNRKLLVRPLNSQPVIYHWRIILCFYLERSVRFKNCGLQEILLGMFIIRTWALYMSMPDEYYNIYKFEWGLLQILVYAYFATGYPHIGQSASSRLRNLCWGEAGRRRLQRITSSHLYVDLKNFRMKLKSTHPLRRTTNRRSYTGLYVPSGINWLEFIIS